MMHEPLDTEDTKDTKARISLVIRVLRVLRVLVCVERVAQRGAAQMTGAPAAGYKREPGMTSSALPAPLREIGFDQNLDQPRAARHAVPRRDRAARSGSATTSASGRSCSCSRTTTARCCARRSSTALASALGVLSLEPGKDFEIVTVSFDPRDTPAAAAAKKAVYLRALQAARRRGGLALPDRRPAVDRAADEGGRVPLRLGRARRSSSRIRPASSSLTPGRPAGAVPVRHRIRPARSAAGVVEASAGKVGSPVDSLLLYCYHYDPMTGRYGLRHHARDAPRRRRHRPRARRVHRRHGAARSVAAREPARSSAAAVDGRRLEA